MPQLAGIPIHETLVHEIASLLYDAGSHHSAERLEDALAHDRPIVALSTRDRDEILAVLDDPPEGLLSSGPCS